MRYTFLGISFICLLAFACTKDRPVAVVHEALVTKTVAYTVYTATNYSNTYYDNVKGQLELSIAKVSNNGTTSEILWDTVFTWRQLAVYPSFQNKIIIRKEFLVLDSKEKLQISFVRKYNFQGTLSQTAIGAPAPDGNTPVRYNVEM